MLLNGSNANSLAFSDHRSGFGGGDYFSRAKGFLLPREKLNRCDESFPFLSSPLHRSMYLPIVWYQSCEVSKELHTAQEIFHGLTRSAMAVNIRLIKFAYEDMVNGRFEIAGLWVYFLFFDRNRRF